MKKLARYAILITFGAGLVAFVIHDVVAATNDEPGDTLSELVNRLGEGYLGIVLVLVLAVGFVLGHVFWPQYRDRAK
jgi:TRAP-type uncharacterized transport system fused permease subunit